MAKGPQTGTRKLTERRGSAFGNKRGKEAQRRRAELRLSKPRVRNALAEVAAHQARLEAQLQHQSTGELLATVTVPIRRWDKVAHEHVAAVVERPVPVVAMDDRALGEKGWDVGQARLLYLDGYPLDWVVARTGWGAWWFSDLVGRDGYAVDLRRESEAWAA